MKFAFNAAAFVALWPSFSAAENVLAAYIFHRHGDRTPKALAPANLTDLGFQEVVTSGDYYRSRYVESNSPLRIQGINADTVKLSQLSISAPADNVLMSSAYGFTQGLYPPVPNSYETLRNGTRIDRPMNGYQLIPVATVSSGTGSENSGWLQSSTDCKNAIVSSNEYFYTSDYMDMLNSTMSFYQMLDPVVNTTFNASSTNFKNAYTIFDYINVAEIHNQTIPASDLLTNNTLLQLRTLADTHEFNLAYNASSTIRAIAGMQLAAQVVDYLNSTITGKGKAKLGVQFGNYATMQSYFGLAGLAGVAGDMFYGIPDYASSLVWELYTNSTTTNETQALSNLSDLSIRFLFHNGTASNISQPTAYPLFGQQSTEMAWNDFVSGMDKFSVGTTEDWCHACGNTTGTCASYSSSSSSSSAGSSSQSSSSGSGISNAVAGVIGAMVTLGVILLVEGAIMLLGGFRLVSRKRLVRGRNTANGGVEKGSSPHS